MKEQVVLVDKNNIPIGTALKSKVHTKKTPLHRAFSCFLFNTEKKLLLQQRSHTKKTWPFVWSNSCCGHPLPDETTEHAIKRRLNDELGMTEVSLYEVLPDFRYQAVLNGVMENEICPVWIGFTEQEPDINPDEVESTTWVGWDDFCTNIVFNKTESFGEISPWCQEEVKLLQGNTTFNKLFSKKINVYSQYTFKKQEAGIMNQEFYTP